MIAHQRHHHHRHAAVAAEIMPGRPPVKAMTMAIATEA